jgi:hypothetical protein
MIAWAEIYWKFSGRDPSATVVSKIYFLLVPVKATGATRMKFVLYFQ